MIHVGIHAGTHVHCTSQDDLDVNSEHYWDWAARQPKRRSAGMTKSSMWSVRTADASFPS